MYLPKSQLAGRVHLRKFHDDDFFFIRGNPFCSHSIASITTTTGTRACSKDEESLMAWSVVISVALAEWIEVLTSVATNFVVDVGTAVPAHIPFRPLQVAKLVSVGATNVVLRGNAVPVPMLEPVPAIPTA